MNTIKFYFNQFGKSCGYKDCTNKGYFPLLTREGMPRFRVSIWVSCARKHKVSY